MNSFDSELFNKSLWKGAYIVGGSVRDHLLGRTPLDFDVAVFGDAKKFAQRLAQTGTGLKWENRISRSTAWLWII